MRKRSTARRDEPRELAGVGGDDLQGDELRLDLEVGLEHCRAGNWDSGLSYLRRVGDRVRSGERLPSVFYSCLGHGIALREGRTREGLALCEHAVRQEFFVGENYANLARVWLLLGRKRRAVEVVEKGLRVEGSCTALLILRHELGCRRPPPLRFLPRRHPLNRVLGHIRHQVLESLAVLGSDLTA